MKHKDLDVSIAIFAIICVGIMSLFIVFSAITNTPFQMTMTTVTPGSNIVPITIVIDAKPEIEANTNAEKGAVEHPGNSSQKSHK